MAVPDRGSRRGLWYAAAVVLWLPWFVLVGLTGARVGAWLQLIPGPESIGALFPFSQENVLLSPPAQLLLLAVLAIVAGFVGVAALRLLGAPRYVWVPCAFASVLILAALDAYCNRSLRGDRGFAPPDIKTLAHVALALVMGLGCFGGSSVRPPRPSRQPPPADVADSEDTESATVALRRR